MSTDVVDRVDSWDQRSLSGGYRGLHDLADEEFSGVVRAGGAELCMTRGVVVGMRMGDIEDFEGASGTIYEAPADALPLLAVMQDRSDEVRAKYYTEDTSISKVDKTLSDGGFTGYVELSENVLSGDYYLVYHAGKSMSVAFVGESSRLIDGDEAFETADGEVGIYKVRPVDIDRIEIPEPSASTGTTSDGSTTETSTSEKQSASGGTTPSGGGAAGATTGETTQREDSPESADPSGATESADTSPGGRSAETSSPAGQQESEHPRQTKVDETRQHDTQRAESSGSAGRESEETPRQEQSELRRQESTGSTRQESPNSTRQESSTSERQESPRGTSGSDPAAAERSQQTRQQGSGRTPSDPQRRARDDTNSGASRQRDQSRPDQGSNRASSSGTAQSGHETARGRSESSQNQRGSRQPQPSVGGGGGPQQASGATQSQGLERRVVPSLDPSKTAIPDQRPGQEPTQTPATDQSGSQPASGAAQPAGAASREKQPTESPQESSPEPQTTPAQGEQSAQSQSQPTQGQQDREEPAQADQSEPTQQQPQDVEQAQQVPAEVVDERVEKLETELDDKETEIERLETELAEETEQREHLQRQLEEVRSEREELAAEVGQLEDELERLEEEFGAATNADRRLTAPEALSGTDIFVRYHSKGKATLEKAHGGSTRRDDVNENLRLEKHTQFDAESASVGGQSYAKFLEGTLEYQFVEWVVRELLFEIRDTGHQKALQDLYDVLPEVDRAELSGVIRVTYTEDGQETQSEETFDIVLRDRMGNPLLVANLNDTREATTESMMEGLITAAERVGQSAETFSGAFYVTESFFDPSALEIAEEATKGGLLSRDKRKSFVNLSRKQGYHLCLVEARNENFHLAVPEL